jgi:hypothetical protein
LIDRLIEVKHRLVCLALVLVCPNVFSQQLPELVLPDSIGWNILNENDIAQFQLKLAEYDGPAFYTVEGAEGLGMELDTLGNFWWQPSYDLVDRVALTRDISVIFQARLPSGARVRKPVTFTVKHVNRPPVVEDLPVFYVRQSSPNTYQIPSEYMYDPDGDPIVVRTVPGALPEGAVLSSQGQLTWTPSRHQFYELRANPLIIEFFVQDQPDKLETRGLLRIQQTQLDLPPDILIVPGDSLFSIKEDETLNLKIYLSDPNGDDNVKSAGFIANDTRLKPSTMKENTPLQYEFTWTPGYDFVEEVQKKLLTEITFYALDKSNNRSQKKVYIEVHDTENVELKDAHQYQKYRGILVNAHVLLKQLEQNQKQLNADYKQARRGKKNRSILNAGLGATTGIAPVTMETEDAKIVSGIGGTTVLTLGTLEATEVVGKSKDAIMDKIKLNIDLTNRIQSAGDEFARKYSLKSARRQPEFEKDIEKLRGTLTDQKLVLLELDAYSRENDPSRVSDRDIKRTFLDFAEY